MGDDRARCEREVAGLVVDELDGRDWALESACLSVREVAHRLGISTAGAAGAISRLVSDGRLRCYSAPPTGRAGDDERLLALAPTPALMRELGREVY